MPSEIQSKSPLASKLNGVGAALVASGALAAFVDPVAKFGAEVVNLLPPQYQPLALSALGMLIIVVRTFFTSQPVRVG